MVGRDRTSRDPNIATIRSAAEQYTIAMSQRYTAISRSGARNPNVLVAPWKRVVIKTLARVNFMSQAAITDKAIVQSTKARRGMSF
jgi:hypothetical protein